MKSLLTKIAVFFTLLLVVVIALYWSSKGNNHPILKDEQSLYYSQVADSITHEWERQIKWNKELHEGLRSYIAVSKNMLKLSDKDVEGLHSLNNSYAAELIFKGIVREWSKNNCSQLEIETYYTGLMGIANSDKSFSSSSNTKVKEIVETYTLYKDILHYGDSTWCLAPQFNPDNSSWNSVEAYMDTLCAKASRYQKHKRYGKIENAQKIKDCLSESALQKKRSDCAVTFYNTLWEEISSAYPEISLDVSDYNSYAALLDRYNQLDLRVNRLEKVYKALSSVENAYSSDKEAREACNYTRRNVSNRRKFYYKPFTDVKNKLCINYNEKCE